MSFLITRYKVEDYSEWKDVFKETKESRKKAGEKKYRVFRNYNNKNEIIVLQEWDSIKKAENYADSKGLRNCLKKAGVIDKPDIFVLTESRK